MRMFKTLKLIVDVFKANLMVANGDTNEQYISILDGKVVTLCDTFMLAVGGSYAAMCTTLNGSHRIVVNSSFLDLPYPVQEFIYYHEEGHSVLEHTSDPTRLKVARRGGLSIKEAEADSYSAEVVGFDQAVASLFYIKEDHIRQYGKSLSTLEIDARISRLIKR